MTELPNIILHNTISLNGALSGFQANLNLHYGIAQGFEADAYLVGSNSILSVGDTIPPEEKSDFEKKGSDYIHLPYWVVVDSKGQLTGLLHYYRKMEYIREIIVLITEDTPRAYVNYLTERNFDYISTSDDQVDLKKAFSLLKSVYKIERLLSDSGSTLNNILISSNLVNELSLVISPVLLTATENILFSGLKLDKELKLELIETKELEDNNLWIWYKVENH